MRFRQWFAVLAVVCAFSTFLSCDEKANSNLMLREGAASSRTLALYYDALAATIIDGWQFEAVYSAANGVKFGDEDQKPYGERLQALNKRAELARQLGVLYAELERLRDPKAAEGALAAGTKLARTLQSLPHMPGLTGVDPGAILGKAATVLIEWKLNRDWQKANRAMIATLDGLSALFAGERESYDRIALERDEGADILVETLASKNVVNTAPLLRQMVTSLGVPWQDNGNAERNQLVLDLSLALAKTRARRTQLLSACATDGAAAMLSQLAEGHRTLASGRRLDVQELERAVKRTDACLEARSSLRIGKQD